MEATHRTIGSSEASSPLAHPSAPRAHVRSSLAILGAAALFSTGGAAFKASALTGWQLASFRSGVAALAVFVMLPACRRRPGARALIVGAAYAVTMILFVVSNKMTTAANAIFLQSTAPLYVMLLSPWLLRERIRARDVGFMIAIAIGMSAFFLGAEPVRPSAPDPARGNVLAALAGLTWAFTVIGLRGMARPGRDTERAGAGPRTPIETPLEAPAYGSMETASLRSTGAAPHQVEADRAARQGPTLPPSRRPPFETAPEESAARQGGGDGQVASAVLCGNVLAFLACLPPALPVAGARPADWIVVAYLGVFQIGIAYVLLTYGMRHVGALEASLLLLLEPVLNPIWAWLAHGETPRTWALAGGAIILLSTIVRTRLDSSDPRRGEADV